MADIDVSSLCPSSPLSTSLRPEQISATLHAIQQNTIVTMPTGSGKTHVAALVISYFASSYPDKKILFVVPTAALVTQQRDYIFQHSGVVFSVVDGKRVDHFTAGFIGTSESVRRFIMEQCSLKAEDLSLVVFDECHHAVGNSSMLSIAKHLLRNIQGFTGFPRVLGLSASIIQGNLNQPEKDRFLLEVNLKSVVFAPAELKFNKMREFHQVYWEKKISSDFSTARTLVEELSRIIHEDRTNADHDRCMLYCDEIMKNVGIFGIQHYVERNLHRQIIKTLDMLLCLKRINSDEYKQRKAKADEIIRKIMLLNISTDCNLKHNVLVDLIREKLKSQSSRGVVFVKLVCIVEPLQSFLETKFPCEVGSITGVGSMSEADRNRTISEFKANTIRIVVATQAAEEGLDIPQCSFVIRYDKFDTTKSHVQGSGRARKDTAEIYYFENNPQEEIEKEKILEAINKQKGVHESDVEEFHREIRKQESLAGGRYPYTTKAGAVLDFTNCIVKFSEYCQTVLKKNFSKSDLFEIEIVRQSGTTAQRLFRHVQFPCPEGWQIFGTKEADQFWGDIQVDDIIPLEQRAKWSSYDKAERRTTFALMIHLIESEWIGSDLKASSLTCVRCANLRGGPIPKSIITLARPRFRAMNHQSLEASVAVNHKSEIKDSKDLSLNDWSEHSNDIDIALDVFIPDNEICSDSKVDIFVESIVNTKSTLQTGATRRFPNISAGQMISYTHSSIGGKYRSTCTIFSGDNSIGTFEAQSKATYLQKKFSDFDSAREMIRKLILSEIVPIKYFE